MSSFFYWSGFAAWIVGGCVGLLLAFDWAVDQLAESFKFKREFLAFVWARLKAKSHTGGENG